MNRLLVLALGVGPFLCAAPKPRPFTYHCVTADNAHYYILLKDSIRTLTRELKTGTEVVALTPNQTAPDYKGGQVLVFNGWKAKAATLAERYLMDKEVRVSFFASPAGSGSEVGIFWDNRLVSPLKCEPGGVKSIVQGLNPEPALADFDGEWVLSQMGNVNSDGNLKVESLLRVQTIIKRFLISEDSANPQAVALFASKVLSGLKYLPNKAIDLLRADFSPREKAVFNEALKLAGHEQLSETNRVLFFVKEGVKGNDDAVRAGVRLFIDSGASKDGDVRAYFLKETKAAWQSLSATDINRISTQLKVGEKEFLKSMWSEANGQGPIKEFAAVERMAAEFNAALIGIDEKDKWGSDGPALTRIQTKLTEFMKSPIYADAELKEFFRQQVVAQVVRVPSAKVTRLQAWLTPDEWSYFQTLFTGTEAVPSPAKK